MRIGFNLHFSDDFLSGVEYYSLSLIRALLDYVDGNQYVVFTNRPDLVMRYVGAADALTVIQAPYPRGRPFRIFWEHALLPSFARAESLDLLHCPCYICPLRTAGVPYAVTVHDTIAIDHPQWCKRSNAAYYNLVMRSALRRASVVVAVSRASAEALRRNCLVDEARLRVIYSGVDPLFAGRASPSQMRAVRARYSLPEQYILYVGNIEPKKNLVGLLGAYRLLARAGFPHGLVLVGHRHWKSGRVFREARRRDLAHKVLFAGYVAREDLPAVYQMAALYVCTSLYEGFGFPPLEAMASGLPVVSSRRGALGETLGDSAYGVEPTDPRAVADAMALMLSDDGLRLEYRRRGVERSRNFTWSRTAVELGAVYRELAS